jgi:hypothetical protein
VKDEDKLMAELRNNDMKLSKEIYEKILDPTAVLNILIKKLQMYNQTEASLSEPVNRLILSSLKAAVENQMMIIQIKRDMDQQFAQTNNRIDELQKKVNDLYESGYLCIICWPLNCIYSILHTEDVYPAVPIVPLDANFSTDPKCQTIVYTNLYYWFTIISTLTYYL